MNSKAVTRHLVSTDDGYMHVRSTGEHGAETPDILFLHQVPGSSRIWLPVMKLLPEFSCISPDQLNLGESDATDRMLTLEEHAEHLWAAGQQLQPGPKILVGHHTGAAMAAAIASAHSADVVGAMFIGYPYYPTWKEKLEKYGRLQPAGTQDSGEGVASAWRFIVNAFEPESDRDLVFEAFADRMRAGRVWYEGYVALWNSDLEGLARGVAAKGVRARVIAPHRDPLSRHADACTALLGADLIELQGGSFILTEHPEVVADLIRDFIQAAS